MTSDDPNTPRPPISAHQPKWDRVLGTTVGCVIFVVGLFFWILSLGAFISKSQGETIAFQETRALSVLSLVIYAVISAIGLLVVGIANGATSLLTRIGFIVYVLFLVVGIVLIAV